MFTKYIKSLNTQSFPVVLSITDTTSILEVPTIIQRNHVRSDRRSEAIDIYGRAREIYFRARRQAPVHAAATM